MTHALLALRHLVGDGVRYRAVGAPPWLVAALDGDGSSDGPLVPVAWRQSLAEVPELESAHAFIGIDSRDCSDEALARAGFPHVRRFAVLPSAREARWFIPLDHGAAAAALSLYRPVRAPARAIHAAARAAASLDLPLWYRDQLCVARRALSPIEELLERCFPTETVRVAWSRGAIGRVEHGKLSLAAVSTRGRVLAFAKSGASGVARRLVRHEAEVLRALGTRDGLAGRVPRLLHAGEVSGSFVHIQAPLAGTPPRSTLGAPERELLAVLRGGERRSAADSAFVRAMRERASELPARHGAITRLVARLMPRLVRVRVPATVVHGDFAPWNLRVHDGVAGAFDWEYGEPDGLPLVDECNHMLLVGYLMHGWTIDVAVSRLEAMARSAPLGLAAPEVEALQLAYLAALVTRFLDEGAEDEPLTQWFTQLLFALSPSVDAGGSARDPRPKLALVGVDASP